MPTFKDEELIMTKKQESNEHFTPLSAVATSITTMGINEEGEFFQETKPIGDDVAADALDQSESSERSPADIAAQFANEFLMHRHRGVINCDSYHIIFGNDGWATDHRSRKEMADVWGKLREYEPEGGFSGDKTTWALVLTDHSRSLFNEEELNQLVWDTWMEVCDELAK
jgi:hypothetical protein